MNPFSTIGIYVLGVLTGLLLASFGNNQVHLATINSVVRKGMDDTLNYGGSAAAVAPPASPVVAPPAGPVVLTTSSSSSVAFNKMIQTGFEPIVQNEQERISLPRKEFDLSTWKQQTDGGLNDQDRTLLSRLYREASSVFEYGLGESTYIANTVGVPYYAGIDSDAVWVSMARDKVNHAFRFYLADIGPTVYWGHPKQKLAKQVYQYELSPLVAEPKPFDVYMVDGRYRPACVFASFLHASSRGGDPSKTKVLLHDCGATKEINDKVKKRRNYRSSEHLIEMVEHSGNLLCVYQRRNTTTDEDLLNRWMQLRNGENR